MNIYSSAFNIVDNGFIGYEKNIINFSNFADNVFIAVNKSKDKTLDTLNNLSKSYPNVYITSIDIDYNDPLIDGKVKNTSLKFAEENSNSNYFIGLDLDEYIPINQKHVWQYYFELFIDSYKWDGILLPSLDLWGDYEGVKWNNGKGRKYKWYLHRRGLSRGPVPHGLTKEGYLDINTSDGCDLLKENGELCYAPRIDSHLDNITDCKEYYSQLEAFVIHEGYLNLESRIERNKKFWAKNWNNCSNRQDVIIPTKLDEFNSDGLEKHGLTI